MREIKCCDDRCRLIEHSVIRVEINQELSSDGTDVADQVQNVDKSPQRQMSAASTDAQVNCS